jgi:predicted house-cleaning noncanonical NTP pyrophosphatase (MazG superfamily)
MDLIESLNRIHGHFGHDNQKVKLIEECEEYLESMELQEIADVFVLSAQLVFNNQDLMDIVEFKIARTIERINSGYYDTRDCK